MIVFRCAVSAGMWFQSRAAEILLVLVAPTWELGLTYRFDKH